MKLFRLLALLMTIIAVGCNNENDLANKTWFKGNLHTHSYWSDGDDFPEMILDWYKEHGYDFVALSDHNTIAEGEKWKTIKEDSIYQVGFQKYLKKYGEDWVKFRNDSGKLEVKLKTFEEYKTKIEEASEFLIIRSEEITDQYEGKPIHMNATNIHEFIEPQGGTSVADVMQRNIDAVNQQRQDLGIPIIPHVNHPNFGYAITLEDMIALNGEQFFEVYNGHPQVHIMGDTLHISTEEMWDLINIAYIDAGKPIMFGLATDDSHHYHKKGNSWSNAGRGWIYVLAEHLDANSIINALEKGDFYASTGVVLNRISFEDNELEVEVKDEEDVEYTIAFIGYRKGSEEPEELSIENGVVATYKIPEDVLFVRCKVTSSLPEAEPSEYLLNQSAWTQPFLRN